MRSLHVVRGIDRILSKSWNLSLAFGSDPPAGTISAAIIVDGRPVGHLFASGQAPTEPRLVRDLLELGAGEIATVHNERRIEPAPAATRYSYDDIIGRSQPMQALYRLLDKVADSEATVLIQGENGTGKELIARAIHFNSPRKDRRFVAQNC